MSMTLMRAIVLLSLISVAACDRRSIDPPLPSAQTSRPVVPSVPDPSVPSATTVLTAPVAPTATDTPSARPTGTLTAAQEANAMPMPGQVNNHSTPSLDPAKRGASAP